MKLILRNTNQAQELASFAIHFLESAVPSPEVMHLTKLWHTDSVLNALVSYKFNINPVFPSLLTEASLYKSEIGAPIYYQSSKVSAEKAVMANISLINDFYQVNSVEDCKYPQYFPVVMAAAQQRGLIGSQAIKGMVLIEELRLALSNSLKVDESINEYLSGGIASVLAYGALIGASKTQIEKALGIFVNKTPIMQQTRKIERYEIVENSLSSVIKAMVNAPGAEDCFRRSFLKDFPFDLELPTAGDNFAVREFFFRYGAYNFIFANSIESLFFIIRKERAVIKNLNTVKTIEFRLAKNMHALISSWGPQESGVFSKVYYSLPITIALMLQKCETQKFNTHMFNTIESIYKISILTMKDFIATDPMSAELKNLSGRIQVVCDETLPTNGAVCKIELGDRVLESKIFENSLGSPQHAGTSFISLMYEKTRATAMNITTSPKIYLSKLDNLENTQSNIEHLYDLNRLIYK